MCENDRPYEDARLVQAEGVNILTDPIYAEKAGPFGLGPRICIGASFAMQEGVIALACLMKAHRFDLVEGFKPWPVQKLTTQPQGGLPMRVSGR